MILHVDQLHPRIVVTMKWGAGQPAGEILLYMKRAGDAAEFAVFTPIQVAGWNVTFQFDDILWVQPQGRYVGRLTVGDLTMAVLDIEWTDKTVMLNAENPNVQSSV